MRSSILKNFPQVVLFILGAYLWGTFFNWGSVPLDFADWSDITAPRLTFLKDAINRGEWPLHTADKSTVGGVTDRYQAIPDAMMSPQILLMGFLSVGQFVLVNTLLLYTCGFFGLNWLKRRFNLSFLPFTALFLLFNFNGHIVAHLSVGHATWGGYFLLPWFAVLVIKLLDGEGGWRWAGKTAILLLLILLQGSYHQYVWLLFFLGFLAITDRRYFWMAIRTGLFSVLLAMPRLWPPSLAAADYESRFHGGFVGIGDLWSAFTVPQLPGTFFASPLFLKPLGWWELTHFTGLAGILFVFLFGISGWLNKPTTWPRYQILLIPILGMAALSFTGVFSQIREIPFPLFVGERVASRMMSLPLMFLVVLSTAGFQLWLERPLFLVWLKPLVGLAVVIFIGIELWQNLHAWDVLSAYQAFPHEKFIPWMWTEANRYEDLVYIRAIQKGLLVCTASLLVLAGLIWVEHKK